MARLFAPVGSATLAATAVSARVALPGAFANAQVRTVRLYNAGPVDAFLAFGDGTVTATAGGAATASPDGAMCLPPGPLELLELPRAVTHVAAVCAAGGNALIRITTGEGE